MLHSCEIKYILILCNHRTIVQSGQILFVVKLHILRIPTFIKSSFKAISCISCPVITTQVQLTVVLVN